MKQLFLTSIVKPLERWSAAFADLTLCSSLDGVSSDTLVWLDCSQCPGDLEILLDRLQARGIRFVAMEPALADDRGLWFMQRGAAGYAHRYANPEQLTDIARVIQSGGVWMGQTLLQRALQVSLTIGRELVTAQNPSEPPAHTASLTERERAVATEVGKGASNREIAATLNVSERTVKAHLSVVFEKMQVRDRVQLALLMNNVQI